MAIDLTTGETGHPSALLIKAHERRQKAWADHLARGRFRIRESRANGRRITPTRFYNLLHGHTGWWRPSNYE